MKLLSIADNVWIDPDEISAIKPYKPTEFGSGHSVEITLKSGKAIIISGPTGNENARQLIAQLIRKIEEFGL